MSWICWLFGFDAGLAALQGDASRGPMVGAIGGQGNTHTSVLFRNNLKSPVTALSKDLAPWLDDSSHDFRPRPLAHRELLATALVSFSASV